MAFFSLSDWGDQAIVGGEPDIDLRVTALFKATAATDGGHEIHPLIFHRILLIFFRRRDVFLRGGHRRG